MVDAVPAFESITSLSARMRAGRLSPVGCVEALLARIDALDGRLHSFIRLLPERALAQAHAAESALKSGAELGMLYGIPYAAKDLFDVKGVPTTAGTRFGYGRMVQQGNSGSLFRDNLPNSSNTVFLALTHNCASGGGAVNFASITLRENTQSQVAITWNGSNQAIEIRSGGSGGTLVATYPTAFSAGQWNHWQVKLVIHNTAGEVHIRKNGDTADTFVATGINTRGGTTNNFINGISFSKDAGIGNLTSWDDLLMYDNSGAAPNDWVGDIRSYALLPTANTAQKDFVSNPSTFNVLTTTGSTGSRVANALYVSAAFVPGLDGPLTKVTLKLLANMTGNLNACLYDNTNLGNAGNVLATGTAVNNPVTGLVDITFPTPATVLPATNYRIGLLADAGFSTDGAGGDPNWFSKAGVTYAGGFPANPSGMSAFTNMFFLQGTVANPANYSSVNEQTPNSDTSFVYSSTVGATDIYAMADLPTTPLNIVMLQASVIMRKSDTATRFGQMVFKSGGTTDLSPSVVQGTSYGGLLKMYPLDPNTGALWTTAAVNALQLGMKVSA
jgi:hypothetical protein